MREAEVLPARRLVRKLVGDGVLDLDELERSGRVAADLRSAAVVELDVHGSIAVVGAGDADDGRGELDGLAVVEQELLAGDVLDLLARDAVHLGVADEPDRDDRVVLHLVAVDLGRGDAELVGGIGEGDVGELGAVGAAEHGAVVGVGRGRHQHLGVVAAVDVAVVVRAGVERGEAGDRGGLGHAHVLDDQVGVRGGGGDDDARGGRVAFQLVLGRVAGADARGQQGHVHFRAVVGGADPQDAGRAGEGEEDGRDVGLGPGEGQVLLVHDFLLMGTPITELLVSPETGLRAS